MKFTSFKTRRIPATPVGMRLKNIRRRKKITLEELEQKTRVHAKNLAAIEKGEYEHLPAEVYALGFVKSYLETLNPKNLNWQKKYLNDFRREFSAWRNQTRGKLRINQTLHNPRFMITPKFILALFAFILVSASGGYIWHQIRFLTAAPTLTILSPDGKKIVETNTVEIIGRVDQNADLMINNQPINASRDGSFRQKIKLSSGLNNIEIRAKNRFNKQTVKNIQILKSRGEGTTKI